MHSWVGYYNTAFNKGEFLETTVDRPFFYQFDDTGGFLPMQDVGVTATGKIPSGKLGLDYVLEAGNGRSWGLNVEPTQNFQDRNDSKSINGGLFVRPDWASDLQASVDRFAVIAVLEVLCRLYVEPPRPPIADLENII